MTLVTIPSGSAIILTADWENEWISCSHLSVCRCLILIILTVSFIYLNGLLKVIHLSTDVMIVWHNWALCPNANSLEKVLNTVQPLFSRSHLSSSWQERGKQTLLSHTTPWPRTNTHTPHTFQEHKSRGLELWSWRSSDWHSRVTFSEEKKLTANKETPENNFCL